MPDSGIIKEFMDYGALWGFAILVVVVIWKKVLPWGDRYLTSVEKLHDSLGEKIGAQQVLCEKHAKVLGNHDHAMREAALEACQMCRAIAEKELPNSAVMVGKHCDEIERIIGEA